MDADVRAVRQPRWTRLALVLAVALLVALAAWFLFGRYPAAGTVIDGWTIGGVANCHDRVIYSDSVETGRGRCDELLPTATRKLDQVDPGHAPIRSATLFDKGGLHAGGPQFVAVFNLADGSVRAIGVGWPGVATQPLAIEYGASPVP